MSELRQAMRGLRRNPGMTTLAIMTLGLGIGVTTASFSAVYAAVLRPIPFDRPEQLAFLQTTRRTAAEGLARLRWSYPLAGQVRGHARAFVSLATFTRTSVALSASANQADDTAGRAESVERAGAEVERAGAEQVDGEIVSWGYFETLHVAPAVGRVFSPDEEAPGHPVAVIGDALWRSRFGADPGVTNRSIRVNGVPLAVVGVMPAGFNGVSGHGALWLPAGMAPSLTYRDYLTTPQLFINLIGRLRDGVTFAQGNAELAALGRALHPEAADVTPAVWSAVAVPLGEARVDPRQRRALLLLLAGSAGVLLVTSVNVALLLLAQARARRGEVAIRVALGALPARLLRQTLMESALIAAAGAATGTVVAAWAVSWLRVAALASPPSPVNAYGQVSSFSSPAMDGVSLVCAATVAALSAVLAGLAPAIASARSNPAAVLSHTSRGLAGGGPGRVMSTLVMAQIAIAVLMSSGAVLLVRTVYDLQNGQSAFDGRALSFWIDAPASRYANRDGPAIVERLLDRIAAVPGVIEAGVNRCTPYGSSCARSNLFGPGRSTRPTDAPAIGRHYVSAGYFRAAGIALRSGRLISDEDRADRPPVVVINETAARRFWPGEDPIGKRVWFGGGSAFMDPSHSLEIVGIVADVKYWPVNEPVGPDFYTSYLQFVWPSSMYVVKVTDAGTVLPAIRRAVAEIDPALAVYDVHRIDERVAEAVAPAHFIAVVTSWFGFSAAALAALGVFGVMAYSVSVRREELALRMALGASPGRLNRGVLGDAASLAVAGSAAGVTAAFWLLPALRAMLYGVSPLDPMTLASVAAATSFLVLLAAAVPAARASAVDPLELLR